MAVTKRTRYEVLRRDGHRCRYCGASADDQPLTIDHVVPVSLGGSDDPSNLVAACRDCNAGKASSNPDAEAVAQVADDAIRWAAAMEKAAENYSAERRRVDEDAARFESSWSQWKVGTSAVPLDSGWRSSLHAMRAAGLPLDEAISLVRVAMESQAAPANKFRYFCGCAWTAIRQIRDEARKYVGQLDGGNTVGQGRCGHCTNCRYLPDDECLVLSGEGQDGAECPECGSPLCLYGLGYSVGTFKGDWDFVSGVRELKEILLNVADRPELIAHDAANRFFDAAAEMYEMGFPGLTLGLPIPGDGYDPVERAAYLIMGPKLHHSSDLDVTERADKSNPYGDSTDLP